MLDRVQSLVQCHFQGLPFGPGVLTTHELHVPYDDVVLPLHIRTSCREADAEFVEDHFFATVHQIVEAWCCVMERQLDAAQAEVDLVLQRSSLASSSSLDDEPVEDLLQRVTRRYRWAGHCWEYLIDHISMLSEMDARDYLSLKFHLHGASGGQSVRLRQLTARIPHLLPWGLPPSELVAMFHAHVSPSSDAVQMLQAVQMLENAVRRFYFGHQQLAIMVLGADASGTQELTVKALERGWKGCHRYLCVEQAKEVMSKQLSDAQSSMLKGRIVRTRIDDAKLRHHNLVIATQDPSNDRGGGGQKMWQASVAPTSPMSTSRSCRSTPSSPSSSPFRAAFARSLSTHPRHTLHFTTYGLGLAPDMALASVQHTHALLSRDLNEVWPEFFQYDVPTAERYVLESLGLSPSEILDSQDNKDGVGSNVPTSCSQHHVNFVSNVHEFLVRVFSCLLPTTRPLVVVTSDAEFVSLTRQLAAWTNSGECIVHQVPLQPFESFGTRVCYRVTSLRLHLVHVSAVYSNSQFRFPDANCYDFLAG
ncbi:hypothetical protein DYB37_008270 [Aphanomyces astaci]|uniref:Hs1pro-1 C-terminal domain-containing protein n=1 Tax=Aphanomyces astaci TaxID=112090 RepID=A0A3R7BQ23_APHAT|nr:hypothetical protein DYB35_007456 [Aphanomyces astaci]RHZ16741.1 hypothetical protein DYB37_008270 [Aphanomyces astaci]